MGWVASSQLLLCGGGRPGAPLLSSPRYAMGGRRGFQNLINPLGMYVASANPICRQRSGVQARTCPSSGRRPWGRLLPGRFGLRPGLGWSSPRKPCNEYQESLPPASSYFLLCCQAPLQLTMSHPFLQNKTQRVVIAFVMSSFIKA